MVDISKKKKRKKENNDIQVMLYCIGALCLNEKHVEEEWSQKNLLAITNKYDPVYKYELVDKPK